MTQDLLPLDWFDTPDMVTDRERLRAMELLTYACGSKVQFHAPHQAENVGVTFQCPGLTTKPCQKNSPHEHHRWATTEAFYWCQPIDYMRRPEIADSVSRRP